MPYHHLFWEKGYDIRQVVIMLWLILRSTKAKARKCLKTIDYCNLCVIWNKNVSVLASTITTGYFPLKYNNTSAVASYFQVIISFI